MASKLDICNLALANLGQKSVASLSDTTNIKVITFNRVYDTALKYTLSDHDWNFAEGRASLTLLADEPVGYDYAYDLPTDCLKIRYLYDETNGSPRVRMVNSRTSGNSIIPYTIMLNEDGNKNILCTDQEDAIAVYTRNITQLNLMSATSYTALAWKVSADMAVPLTKNLSLQSTCVTMYSTYLSRAQRVDFQSTNDKEPSRGKYQKVR